MSKKQPKRQEIEDKVTWMNEMHTLDFLILRVLNKWLCLFNVSFPPRLFGLLVLAVELV